MTFMFYFIFTYKDFLHVILGVNRQKAQEWCIQHGFELVELSPEELPEEDGKCLCWEKTWYLDSDMRLFNSRKKSHNEIQKNSIFSLAI